jgi:hypothetical protein
MIVDSAVAQKGLFAVFHSKNTRRRDEGQCGKCFLAS